MKIVPNDGRAGKALRTAAACAALLVLAGGACGASPRGGFAPPDGKTLLLVGQNRDSVQGYVDAVKVLPAGFMLYTSVQECDGLDRPSDRGAGVVHGRYFVRKYPDAVLQIGLYMVGILDNIIAGEYDGNIDFIGDWVAAADRPVFLRIGYEFDHVDNNYDPEKYVQAYRHIVDRLRENGVDNAAFVWHSAASYPVQYPLEDYYPGDEYVDWFGVSFFDNFSSAPMYKMAAMAKERGKPLMIAEATPAKIGVGQGMQSYYKWYLPFFKFIEKNNVKLVSYINTDWDSLPMFSAYGWKDARVQKNKEIKQLWMDEIAKDRYDLGPSKGLFELLGYRKKQ